MDNQQIIKLKENLEEILKQSLFGEIVLPNFDYLKIILDILEFPKLGINVSLNENSEIRYYPNIIETYNNNKKRIELKDKPGIISDKIGTSRINKSYLGSLELLKFDPNIINVNDMGFVYLREPEFYVTKEKFVYLINFSGTKQNLEEEYYSPNLEYNDQLLYSMEEDEFILYNEN